MPAWSTKERRQYEHIKGSARKRGKSTRRAKEIAARTVNKGKRTTGSSGKGKSQNARGRSDRTRRELYDTAKKLGIKGRSRMNKSQLASAVRERGR